jgi:hypothetical protein
MNTLAKFEELGNRASFHYADDSCKEWDLARDCKDQAEELFVQHPELREEMIKISKGFLWTLSPALKGAY